MQGALVGNVHLVAGGESLLPALLERIAQEGLAHRGDPDLHVRTYKSFGIDEARELRDRAALGAVGARRIFVVATPSMTTEAQNALLKTLEEPGDALFFFLLPAPDALIATLRSRAQALQLDATADEIDARDFLAAAPAARLELLKPLLEKGDDDKRDLGGIFGFLGALERAYASSRAPRGDLRVLYSTRAYIADKGALVKPLLEQLALLLPRP